MNVLHIITGLGNGGAEAVLFRLAMSSQSENLKHHVISLMDRGIYAERLEKAGIFVHCLNFDRGKFSAYGVFRLFTLIRKICPDVVQTWMYHSDLIGGLVARLAGVKAIAWGIRHANLDPQHNSHSTLRVVKLCAYVSDWIPRKIVTCSELAVRIHINIGYQKEKFVHIPNGYNLERFKPDISSRYAIRNALNIKDDEFVLGMVARFDIQKDHRNLIDALSRLKNQGAQFTCLLIGVDMDEGNRMLLDWIEGYDIASHVKLLGARDDIPAIMNAIDIHVLSSLGEAFPNVLAEAMACGTPCVTTDVGDAAFIVGEHGWVVESQNPAALAEGLLRAQNVFMKDNISDWKNLQGACRSRIMANFELELMCEKYRQVWEACTHVQ